MILPFIWPYNEVVPDPIKKCPPYLVGVGPAFVDVFEPHWRAAWDRHTFGKPLAFMTICSHAKPYSKSFIHASIRKHLWEQRLLDKVDYIHISNAGIIPTSAEMTYPFNAYDWDCDIASQEILDYHTDAIGRRLLTWAEEYGHRYPKGAVIYLREEGNTIIGVRKVLEELQSIMRVRVLTTGQVANMPFAAMGERDDCLTTDYPLYSLSRMIKETLG